MASNSAKLSIIRDQYLFGVIDKEIFPSVTGTDQINNPIGIVCDFFLRKATTTLDAICILCEAGLGEDALVLGRTIFELSLHLQAIASPASVEQRRHKAECFIYDGDRQRIAKLQEMVELKKRGKCLLWIAEIEANKPFAETIPVPKDFVRPKRLKDMATELGGEWESWYYFLYWSVSHLAHPSGWQLHIHSRILIKRKQYLKR